MASRFKLDENLPRHAQAMLVSAGHDAHTVNDEQLEGCPDDLTLDACKDENRILVTLDLDFADIRRCPPSAHQGIWVLRPQTQSIADMLTVLRGALALIDIERLRIGYGSLNQKACVFANKTKGTHGYRLSPHECKKIAIAARHHRHDSRFVFVHLDARIQ